MSTDKQFAKGFWFKRNELAPDYVVGNLDITKEAVSFIQENSKDGKLKLAIIRSKGGKYYVEVDKYQPKEKDVVEQSNDDNEPF